MTFSVSDYGTWIWICVMILCLVAEAVSFSLTTIWFALGAFVCVLLSFFPVPFHIQILLFALVSLALLFLTRPVAKKHFCAKKVATNADSLIGRTVVLQRRTDEMEKGEAKIGGIVWQAQSAGGKIEIGEECRISKIQGNTLIVEKIE